MATIVATGTFLSNSLFTSYRITSDGVITDTSTTLAWNMSFPDGTRPSISVTLEGTGFDLSSSGAVAGGTLTKVVLILDRFTFPQPTAEITDFTIPLADVLVNGATGTLDGVALLNGILGGNDVLSLGDGSTAFGDVRDLTSGSASFGHDEISLNGIDGIVWGDAQTVTDGASGIGGNDSLFATGTAFDGFRLVGDAQLVRNANLTGGDDTLKATNTIDPDAGFVQNTLVGDVQEIDGAATVTGGADRLIGTSRGIDRLYGDAELMQNGTGSLIGGDDFLKGRGGADVLYGDLDALATGSLTGGDDTLVGGAGHDLLYGDVGRITGGTLLQGGNDLLKGLNGQDGLLGQSGDDTLLGGGGDDTLVGDQGHDSLKGGSGNDLILGGLGADTMIGGTGIDTFLWTSAADTGETGNRDQVNAFVSGTDLLDLRQMAQQSTTGTLSWVGSDWEGATGTIGYVDTGAKLKLLANLDTDSKVEAVIFFKGIDSLDAGDVLL